jgi:hypothetical protein
LDEPDRQTFLTQALDAAHQAVEQAQSGEQQAELLTALAPHLAGKLAQQALSLAQGIRDPEQHAEILLALVAKLVEGPARQKALTEALDMVEKLQNPTKRAEVLLALAPHLAGKLAQQALSLTQGIRDPEQHAEILLAVAPHLAETDQYSALLTAVEVASNIQNTKQRTQILTDLRLYLGNSSERERISEVCLELRESRLRAERLVKLLPFMVDEPRYYREILLDILEETKVYWRHDMLKLFSIDTLLAPPIVSSAVVSAIGALMIEICSTWNWN